MELTMIKNTKILAHNNQCESVPITLVGKLLATMMTGQSEEISLEGKSHDFLYDSGTAIKTGNTFNTWINSEKITQKDNTIEITLSGIITNNEGDRETLTLYFYMWWDHTQPSPIKNTCMKSLHSVPLLIRPEKTSGRLSDSVFELDMYLKKPSQQQEYIGQGRGYLVFGGKN